MNNLGYYKILADQYYSKDMAAYNVFYPAYYINKLADKSVISNLDSFRQIEISETFKD